MSRFIGVKQISEKGHLMKKIVPALACVVALMLAMPTLAFAGHGAGHHGWRNSGTGQGVVQSCPMGQQGNCGRGYVDADNDGICDNQGQCGRFVDADNDGVCDNMGANGLSCGQCVDADGNGYCDQHKGACFYDKDGDGICDHRQGKNFVDADGDGVCDHQPQHACVDKDGDAVCDLAQKGACPNNAQGCARFVDEDGDGVCDYHHNGAHCTNYNSRNADGADDSTADTAADNAAAARGQNCSRYQLYGHGHGHGCRR